MPAKKAGKSSAKKTRKVMALTSFSANVNGVDRAFTPDEQVEVDADTYKRLQHLLVAVD